MPEMEFQSKDEEITDKYTTRTVGIKRFLKLEPDITGPYVRLFADNDNKQLRAYREVGEQDEPRYWRVVIDDMHFRRRQNVFPATKFDLHDGDAFNFLTWLETLKNARGDIHGSFIWYAKNNAIIHDNANLNQETLFFEWDNDSRDFTVTINSNYANRLQMIADVD